MASITLFGFEITRNKKEEEQREERQKSFVPAQSDDGAVVVQGGTAGSYYGTYLDLDGTIRNEIELITRYRKMSMEQELETAIDHIVNEAIVVDDNAQPVEINLDDVKIPEGIKRKIRDEFKYILKLLNFSNMGHDIFRRWYIDGRIFYHVVIDEKAPKKGIQELRYIDPRRIRKVREIIKTPDQKTGIELIHQTKEYYLYNERGIIGANYSMGARIAVDSVINVNSGLTDAQSGMVLSYLHKAIKPLNQLRMMEDASVIYRLSRAPERRIFYVDVGNLSTIKADQYLKDIVTKYRNKLVYDSTTGEVRDDRRHLSMLEDIWLPRRNGTGTEVSTLPGGANLGEMEDVDYFKNKLYKALGVPVGRLEPQDGFNLGRSTEITRDELNFNKFISRLRNKFASLFDDAMRTQLVLKNICTSEEWRIFKEDIFYDFRKDNNFSELKDAELLMNRLAVLTQLDPFVGRYFSNAWVKKNVLRFDDDAISEMQGEMDQENASAPPQTDEMGNVIPFDSTGQPIPPEQLMPPDPMQQLAPPEPPPPSPILISLGAMQII